MAFLEAVNRMNAAPSLAPWLFNLDFIWHLFEDVDVWEPSTNNLFLNRIIRARPLNWPACLGSNMVADGLAKYIVGHPILLLHLYRLLRFKIQHGITSHHANLLVWLWHNILSFQFGRYHWGILVFVVELHNFWLVYLLLIQLSIDLVGLILCLVASITF